MKNVFLLSTMLLGVPQQMGCSAPHQSSRGSFQRGDHEQQLAFDAAVTQCAVWAGERNRDAGPRIVRKSLYIELVLTDAEAQISLTCGSQSYSVRALPPTNAHSYDEVKRALVARLSSLQNLSVSAKSRRASQDTR